MTGSLENELCYDYNYELCSFSNLSVTSPTSQLILQPFRRFTYVTAHSPSLLSLFLRHRLFIYVTWRAAHAVCTIPGIFFYRFQYSPQRRAEACIQAGGDHIDHSRPVIKHFRTNIVMELFFLSLHEESIPKVLPLSFVTPCIFFVILYLYILFAVLFQLSTAGSF